MVNDASFPSTALASDENNASSSVLPAVANAHARLVSSWLLHADALATVAFASASKSATSAQWSALANAHETLASSWALQSDARFSTARARAAIRSVRSPPRPLLATPCAMLAISRARTSDESLTTLAVCDASDLSESS